MTGSHVDAWRVHDTGLVAAPGPFRRLPGRVRHHRVADDDWPAAVRLSLADGALVVDGVGTWPVREVSVHVVSDGPPVTFVVRAAGAEHLLAAPAAPATTALLAALAGGDESPQ